MKKLYLLLLLGIYNFLIAQTNFHDTTGSIEVNGGGQLQYTLPIALPPGVKSVAPQVNLGYTSGTGNGIAGYGWNISGITSITRMSKTIEKDGEVRGIQLNNSDFYSFNGQRLILKSGSGTNGGNGAEYVTEKYSNIKIKSLGAISGQVWQGPEYWEVTFEDGSQAWYGATTTGTSSARTPIEYNIVKWKDAQGNYITYNYTQANNVAVISSIQWGGNETISKAHFNQIIFNYATRDLKEQSYVNGVSFIQDKILSNVVVNANGSQFKKYLIEYTKDPNGNQYQFVNKITEYNAANEAANPVIFEQQKDKSTSTLGNNNAFNFDDVKLSGDFDGNGAIDNIVYAYSKQITCYSPAPGVCYYSSGTTTVYQPGCGSCGTSVNYSAAGYYVQMGGTYYLGTTDIFKDATVITIKDTQNKLLNNKGFAYYKIDPTTKNITIYYYAIDLSKKISSQSDLVNPQNALQLISTKVITKAEYDETNHMNDGSYMSDTFTSIGKLYEYDVEADGVPELLLLKQNTTTETVCNDGGSGLQLYKTAKSKQKLKSNESVTQRIAPGGDCQYYDYNSYYYILIKQDSSFPYTQMYSSSSKDVLKDAVYGDFNGDGIVDIGSVSTTSSKTPYSYIVNECQYDYYGQQDVCNDVTYTDQVPINNITNYNIVKDSYGNYSFSSIANYLFEGSDSDLQVGDFNGDGKSDLFAKTSVGGHYIINLSKGNGFIASEYFNQFYSTYNITGSDYRNYSIAKAVDINNDGKTDIVNFSTYYKINKPTSYSLRVDEASGYDNGKILFTPKETISNGNAGNYIFQEVLGNFIYRQYNTRFLIYGKSQSSSPSQFWAYDHKSDIQSNKIIGINQGDLKTEIAYSTSSFIPVTNTLTYPYLESSIPEKFVVTGLGQVLATNYGTNTYRFQSFLYKGFTAHLQGRGVIGFRQSARSSWYATGFENTIVWSGTEIDPLNEGLPIKEWSIKTNDVTKVFPANIDINNTSLLSVKLTTYDTSTLANGVKVILPKTSTTKDFLKDVTSVTSMTYGNYYLPTQTITNVNNNYSISTTDLAYIHNFTGIGKDYYIGRPSSKTETVYYLPTSDTKSAKQEYTYNSNNLLETLKTWNRDNSGWLLETYTYDAGNATGFGNITKKVTSNNVDTNTITEEATFDTLGRFVISKKDNLGLITNITYNDWGQVLTQTDPFGVVLTNTYDNWGKTLTSKTNLSATATYAYEKLSNGDAKVTETATTGEQKITYTNKLGQTYKTSTKAFKTAGSFISVESQYDAIGRKIKDSEPYFEGSGASKWNTVEYDDYSRPKKATSFTGKIVETTYSGRTATVTETNATGRFKKQTADAVGYIISTEDKGGIINFKYNAAGENTEAKYDTNVVTNTYDAWGRKTEFYDPSNGKYTYEYNDGFGKLTKETSPSTGYKQYSYNNKGQLDTQTEYLSKNGVILTNKTITYSYNAKGQITGKSGTSLGKSFNSSITYDTYGRPTASIENNTTDSKSFYKNNVIYDTYGRVTSYTKGLTSSGVTTDTNIEHAYDSWSGALYQVKNKTNGAVLWELQTTNARGQTLTEKLGATNITNVYDANNFLSSINHSSTIKPNILSISYSFNAIKNELNSRTTGGDFSITEYFTYDDNNRLINWTNPRTGQQSINIYDSKGRILHNDQVGDIQYSNSQSIYRPSGMTLNANGIANYDNQGTPTSTLIQSITYNENNDPIKIDGVKGDYAFDYGLSESRQVMYYGNNFTSNSGARYIKYYNESGDTEIIRDTQTGKEKHILYIGGTPYESNIVYLKNFQEAQAKFVFLHKDYLGSILAISDEVGNKLEQRHFDAWGNITHLKSGSNATITDRNTIKNTEWLLDRGYTSHEHLKDVEIIHMNGRLYDPLLRRFLNADENIQDPNNTQNYNKYGYVMNNPLMYNDPNGEFFVFLGLGVLFWKAVIIGAAVGLASYSIGVAISGQKWTIGGALKSMFFGAVSGAVTFGIGDLFQVGSIVKAVGNAKFLVQGMAHGVAQGVLSVVQGGSFWSGAAAGFLGHMGGELWGATMNGVGLDKFAKSTMGMVSFGAISGGIGAELSGGNFWQGAVTGGIVAGLNSAMHKIEPPKPKATFKISRPSITFDGERLTLTDNGKEIISVPAMSGRPSEDGSFDYSKDRWDDKGVGPIPEGSYSINTKNIQWWTEQSTLQRTLAFSGLFGIKSLRAGTWPGGLIAWGVARVEINGYNPYGRTNMFIHGGSFPGSAGCIDLMGNDLRFFRALNNYKNTIIPLTVKYK